VEFCVLGPLQVFGDGRPLSLGGRRQRVVLGVLLAHANEVVTTDRLIDDVWGEDPPDSARKSLQVYVSRLRKILGGDVIEAEGSGYVLRTEPDQLDADRFERLARDGHDLARSDPAGAASKLREALELWRGMPWSDIADEPALRPAVERLKELRLATVEDRIETDLGRGRAATVVGELEGLVADHPLRERLRGLLMLALYRDGRQAEALRVYQDTRRLLGEELGIEPSPELQVLERQILGHDPDLDISIEVAVAPAPTAVVRNPYKGLQPFGEADTGDFFGRQSMVEELIGRVVVDRFVAVVGPSGSGKSSVVRAGLIPALRAGAVPGSEKWAIAQTLPGAHPFEELEAALLRAAPDAAPAGLGGQRRGDDLDLLRWVLRILPDEESRLLLVIDQFEELFLLVTDEQVRARFIRNLVEAVEDPHGRLTVVVTLRADFFDRPLDYPLLAPLVVDGQLSVLPITAPELEAATVRPAVGVGVGVEPELVAELIGEVAQQPGVLPLFEFVLTELFEQRVDDRLTLARYRELGGLQGALSRRADELYEQLDEEQRGAAHQVFLRLLTLGEGTEDTRRRVERDELESLESGRPAVEAVLASYGEARLLTFDRSALTNRPTVELAHEALLREWPRLRRWIDEARDDLRLHRALAIELQEWESAGRDEDYLLTGSRLALYDDWSTTTSLGLTDAEHEFVAASDLRRSTEQSAERVRQENEQRLERRALTRLRALVAILAIATIAAVALTAFALNRSSEAERQRDRAEQQTEEAERQKVEAELARDDAVIAGQVVRIKELTAASLANGQTDPELGLLLALYAVDLSDILYDRTGQPVTAELVGALHWSLQAARVQYPVADAPTAVLASPSGPQGIFQLDLPDLIALARQHVDRGLTSAECDTYFDLEVCPSLPAIFPATLTAEAVESVAADPDRPLAGSRVVIMGSQVNEPADAIRAETDRFSELTGIEVEYEGSGEFEDRLDWMLDKGSPPDLAILPQPGRVASLAREGSILDLGAFLDVNTLRDLQSPGLIALGTVSSDGTSPSREGDLYGVAITVGTKSLVWYPVPQFHDAGYEIPTTWDELVALTEQMVADGRTPWCHGEFEAGPFAGWPGTDWIEDIVLHGAGPEVYDRWTTHDIGFDDPAIRIAFERFDSLVLQDGHVYGGREAAAGTYFAEAQRPMFDDPPGCWLYRFGNLAALALPSFGVEFGRDAYFFPFPAADPDYGDATVGSGEFVVAFNDRPEVRELVRYMSGSDWGHVGWTEWPTFIAPNRHIPLETYTDDFTRQMAEITTWALEQDTFRYDGSDLMPFEVGGPVFWSAMVDYVGAGPDNLDEILARLDAAWDELEQSDP
jgi:DNA-binding SARP family transcriptional activator/ABC-type glycerol-3-phosphate transport system substrate-binding protein